MSERSINRILVVDDEQSVRDLLAIYLTRRGFDVVAGWDGEMGLQRFAGGRFDIVFADIVMPRMGGLDMATKIREVSPDVFIVIMTGYSDENTAIKSAQLGVADYLVKPFTPQRVDGIIDRLERLAWLRRENKGVVFDDLPIHVDRVDMEIENDLPAAHRIVERVMRMLGIADDDFKLGLLEIVINAIEHGNLQIGFEAKSNLPDIHRYMEFVRERASDPALDGRRVRLSIRREDRKVFCEVADQGLGFDWRKTLENASGMDELLHNGRGLLLAQVMFDELRFDERGSTAYMVKSFEN